MEGLTLYEEKHYKLCFIPYMHFQNSEKIKVRHGDKNCADRRKKTTRMNGTLGKILT